MATNPPGHSPVYKMELTDQDLLSKVEQLEREQQWEEEEIPDDALMEKEEGQTGGGLDVEREGTFEFRATPFRERTAKKYGIKRTSYHLRLENPRNEFPVGPSNIVNAFERGLANTIQEIIRDLPDHDRIQVYLGSNRLGNSHTSAHVSVGAWRDPLGASRQILDNISRLLNSNEQFEPDDTLQLDVTHISIPKPGTGKPKGARNRVTFGTDTFDNVIKEKKSVITIKNNDDLCCGRAIIVAKAVADDDIRLNTIKDSRCHLQTTLARDLYAEARVPPGPCGLEQIALFAIVLPDYQFVVVSAEHGWAIVHKGPEAPKKIMLLMHKGHFDVITKLPGFFGTSYFCLHCEKGYSVEDLAHHRCPGRKCDACLQIGCPDYQLFRYQEKPNVPCRGCNRKFYGVTCQANHLAMKANGQAVAPHERNVCTTHKKCNHCRKIVTTSPAEHAIHCGEQKCPSCEKFVNILQHKCFLQPAKLDKKKKRRRNQENPPHTLFVYFDVEARQETGLHVPNLVCAETHQDDTQYTFWGEECIDDFMAWVHSLANEEDVDKVIVVAHNFKGYDSYFILDYLYKESSTPKQIANGAKILSVDIPNVKFIDSLNFIPMSLSSFPKTFGLQELKKGFFPHFFNTQQNQIYVGYMPEAKYYDPDGMSPSRKEEFEEWYAEKVAENHIFDFRDELLAYCQSDVRLLKQGCLAFQMEFQSICGFNPMQYCITIASVCNTAYRKNWLPKDEIAVEPAQGWRPQFKQSKTALKWLYWQESQLPKVSDLPRIEHAGNKGEYRVTLGQQTYLLDGYDTLTHTAYEFQGCYHHGCKTCFPNRAQRHPYHQNKTMWEVRAATQERIDHLREVGYNVIEKWECEWKRDIKTNPRLQEFLKDLELVSPLNPRDAFFGGRTVAVKLHHEVEGEEQIHYKDMISLYPCTNIECEYPVGHPEFIDQPDDTDISVYHGLVKCRVLPPYGLYHPVLPYRVESKLLFPLCHTCATHQIKQHMSTRTTCCPHSSEERALTGTWTTLELTKAIEKGYQVLKIFEVWHFKQKSQQLFSPYIKTFMKLK